MLKINDKKEIFLAKLAKEYTLELLVLFGSQVSGQTHKESDFDIGYLSVRELSIEEEGKLILQLLPVVEQNDERIINLVNIRKTRPLLLHSLTSEAQVLFQKEPITFDNLRAHAFKSYIETKPLYQARAQAMGIN